jgi:hypothetical protein
VRREHPVVARLEALGERAGGRGRIRPGLPLIVRAWEERALRARVAALREAGFDRWELTNVASWALLGIAADRTGGLDLTADSALHTVNHAAARQLLDMGVRRVTLSTEDSRRNLEALLGQLGPAASVVVFEDSPLFLSESCSYATLRGGCPGPALCDFETMELSSSHGGGMQVLNERCRSVTVGPTTSRRTWPRWSPPAPVRCGCTSMHREYDAEEARAIWRAFRRSPVVRDGHSVSFARGAW